MIRVLIADDHKLLRAGLKSVLGQYADEIEVVGEAASGQEVLRQLDRVAADVVLMDILMPEGNGVETTRLIGQSFPQVKVLMLSMLEDEHWIYESLRVGAKGYLLKTVSSKEFLHGIRTVYEDEEYFCTDLTKLLLRQLQGTPPDPPAPKAPPQDPPKDATAGQPGANLSVKEREVLRLVAQGYTNAEIAEMLSVSRRTVETQRQQLLDKTGTKNTATLIMYAVRHQLLA